jgi:hypothetical protein
VAENFFAGTSGFEIGLTRDLGSDKLQLELLLSPARTAVGWSLEQEEGRLAQLSALSGGFATREGTGGGASAGIFAASDGFGTGVTTTLQQLPHWSGVPTHAGR